jgi:hypothetical protein
MSTCRHCEAAIPPAAGSRERVWCSDRCRKAAARQNGAGGLADDAAPEPESIGDALEALLATVSFDAEDPRSVIVRILRQLVPVFERSPSAALAREIKSLLHDVSDRPSAPPTIIHELRARRAARHVELFLNPNLQPLRRSGEGW